MRGSEMKDHRLIGERSLAFHRLIAAKLRADPALLGLALANLDRWEAGASPRLLPVLAEWRALLAGPPDELLTVLTGENERSARPRQSSPFAGALTSGERFAVLREFQTRKSRAA